MEWSDSALWLTIGFVGQAAFFSRFLVQWVASERAGRSYVPVAFWYLSLAGSLILLVYAIHRKEIVFVVGQAFGWIVYSRNLILLKRTGGSLSPSAETNAPPPAA